MKEKEDRNELIESDDVTSFNERTNENFESSSYQHQSAFESFKRVPQGKEEYFIMANYQDYLDKLGQFL